MAHRLKWLIILTFVVAQFSMANGAFAAAKPVTAMANCDAAAGNCCDFGAIDHCSACVACAAYALPKAYSQAKDFPQIHQVAATLVLYAMPSGLDPPPPRS